MGDIDGAGFITLLAAWRWCGRSRLGRNRANMRRIVFLHGLAENDPKRRRARGISGKAGGGSLDGEPQYSNRASVFCRRCRQIQSYATELVTSAPTSSLPAALRSRRVETGDARHSDVFSVVNDPVGQASSRAWRGRAAISPDSPSSSSRWSGKWLEMLKELAPDVRRVALLFNPQTAPTTTVYLREFGAVLQRSLPSCSQRLFAMRPRLKRPSPRSRASPPA